MVVLLVLSNWQTRHCNLTLSRTFLRPAAAAAAAADDDGCDAISVFRMSSSAALAREDHWRNEICSCSESIIISVEFGNLITNRCNRSAEEGHVTVKVGACS